MGEVGEVCVNCLAAYNRATFVARLLSSAPLAHVRAGFLEQIERDGSLCSKILDSLDCYGVVQSVLDNPLGFYDERKTVRQELLRYCLKNHVFKTVNVGSDTRYFSVNKSYGISGYIFNNRIKCVMLLMNFGIGSWRKTSELRDFFLREQRPLCPRCGVELTTEHLFEDCSLFDSQRAALKSKFGLNLQDRAMWTFDSYEMSVELLSLCRSICVHVHVLAGVEESRLLSLL